MRMRSGYRATTDVHGVLTVSKGLFRSAAGDSLLNVASNAIGAAGRALAQILGPTVIGAAEFGLYAQLSWISAVAVQVGSGGQVKAAQRYHLDPSDGEPSKMRYCLAVSSVLGAAVVFGALAVFTVPRGCALSLLAIGLSASVFAAWASVQEAVCQGRLDFKTPFTSELGAQSGRAITLASARALEAFTSRSLLIADLVCGLSKLTLLRRNRNRASVRPRASLAVPLREVALYALSVAGIALLEILLWQRGEIFFLSWLSGVTATAQYAGASQLAQLTVFGPIAALSALLPRLALKFAEDRSAFLSTCSNALSYCVLAALPLFALGVIAGVTVIGWWRPDFGPASSVLPFTMLGRVALFVSCPISIALYASGKQRMVLGVECAMALLACITSWSLVAWFGLLGAAAACLVNQSLTALALLIVGCRALGLRPAIRRTSMLLAFIALLIETALAATGRAYLAGVVAFGCTVGLVLAEPRFRHAVAGWGPRRWLAAGR